jgi:hypothetical protein
MKKNNSELFEGGDVKLHHFMYNFNNIFHIAIYNSFKLPFLFTNLFCTLQLIFLWNFINLYITQAEPHVNSEIIAITQPPTKMWGLIIATCQDKEKKNWCKFLSPKPSDVQLLSTRHVTKVHLLQKFLDPQKHALIDTILPTRNNIEWNWKVIILQNIETQTFKYTLFILSLDISTQEIVIKAINKHVHASPLPRCQ